MYDYTESVQRGIALLDRKAPSDWRDRIDWTNVHIYSLDTCIAGQAVPSQWMETPYGNYRVSGYSVASEWIETLNEANNTDYDCEDYGFNTDEEDYDSDDTEANLINTWKRELGVKV